MERRKLVAILSRIMLILLSACAAEARIVNPEPVFIIQGLGYGYSSPTLTSNRIFVTGEQEGTGYLFAFDLKGKLLWKKSYGREWVTNFRGSRASPTVLDSLIYTSSGMGDIACFDAETGEKKWSVNIIRDLNGENAVFGYSIPVLVDGDRLFCLPGGQDTNIACLNRFTGKMIWSSAGKSETPGYASLLLINLREKKILVAYSELTLFGLNADNGSILWTYELSLTGEAPCNKPIYSDGYLYIAGSGNGAVKFRISTDGSKIEKIWNSDEFHPYFGGFIMMDRYLYGSTQGDNMWLSVDKETGNSVGSLEFYVGSTASAGNKLVLYNQKGNVGLVNCEKGQMTLEKSFMINKGKNEHFAPIILADEMIYIRHGDVLLAYDFQALNKL